MISSRKKLHILLAGVALTLFLYIVFSFIGGLYTYTDNVTVGVVTSGMYGENSICQFLHPLYCKIISSLKPVLPTADVFATLTHVFLLLGIFLLSYIFFSWACQKLIREWQIEDYIARVLGMMTIIYFVLGLSVFGINYTVQTSAIMAMGVFTLFYAAQTKKGTGWSVAGTVLVFGALLDRVEANLLFLPFIVLELLTEIIRDKSKIKEWAKYILPATLLIILMIGSRQIFFSREPYRSDAEYNTYRTICEDYPMRYFNSAAHAPEGLDLEAYKAVLNWTLMDTDIIDTDALKGFAAAGSKTKFKLTGEEIVDILQDMRKESMTMDLHVLVLTWMTILLTVWNVIYVRNKWLKLESLSAFLGGFVIMFYFTYRGRAPLRVWQCVLIPCLTILVFVMIKDAGERKTSSVKSIVQLLLCAILWFGVGQVMANSEFHTFATPLTAKTGARDYVYRPTFKDDSLYIWPWWYQTIPDYFSKQNKLPTQEVIEHNIAQGDWVYGQVYFRDFLKRINAENPALALLDRPNTYLVEGMEDDVLDYLQSHYGEDIEMKHVKYIRGKKVFQFMRGEVTG